MRCLTDHLGAGKRESGKALPLSRFSTLRPGFTLLEALVAIGLTALLLAIYGAVLYSTIFLRRVQYDVQAANFIQEELDTLHTLDYTELLARTNGNFLGLPLTRGPWKVTDMTATGAGRALSLATPQAAIVEETGLAVLPGNYRKNFDLVAKVRVDSASAAGWGAGVAFRYRDAENHYRFRFTSGGIALDKVVHGVKTTLWSQSATYNTNTWYTLEVVATDLNLTLIKNGVTLTTISDATFAQGDTALLALNGAIAAFNDVSVTVGGVTSTWTFDSNAINSYPSDWQRMSFLDLPAGTGTLSIANYLGQADMVQATVNISWTESGSTRKMSGTTIITK